MTSEAATPAAMAKEKGNSKTNKRASIYTMKEADDLKRQA
jgi:hypothetical protein